MTADGDYANGRGNGWMPTDQPAEYRLAEMFTNDEGIFRVEGLPYGQYLVVETTIPKDVFQCDPFIVTVDANSPQSRFTVPAGSVTTPSNNYMTFNVLDEELEGYLQLIKTDTETGRAVKIANTAFALYRLDEKDRKTRISMIDPASGSATKKTDVFYTDAEGLMKTPEKLPLGRYLIEELQGPEGYFNDPAYSVEFEIKSDRVWQVVGNATNDMDEYIVTEKYCQPPNARSAYHPKTGQCADRLPRWSVHLHAGRPCGRSVRNSRCSRHCHTRPPRHLLVQRR